MTALHAAPEGVQRVRASLQDTFAAWLAKEAVDTAHVERLHREAALEMHRHYVASIRSYERLATDLGMREVREAQAAWNELFVTDGLFKSYDESLIDDGDFVGLTRWLNEIVSWPCSPSLDGVRSVEDWFASLEASCGIRARFSSGTTGKMSIVPRSANVGKHGTYAIEFVASALRDRGVELSNCHVFALTFRGGYHGVSSMALRLSQLGKSSYSLLGRPAHADVFRELARNVRPETLSPLAREFRRDSIENATDNYERLAEALAACARTGEPAYLCATPITVLRLCRFLEQVDGRLHLGEGSLLSMAGGWKTFTGDAISPSVLGSLVERHLGIPRERTFDIYGLSECTTVQVTCPQGRYHFAPTVWPLVYDATLSRALPEGTGRIGFSDPFAEPYPGFVVTGDLGHLTREPCPCGRAGATVVGGIRRAPGQQLKGCGGVLGSMSA